MIPPTLCGVIPAYNAAATIADAIDSLLHQSVPLHEIIVVDDGSTDATAAVAAKTGVRVIRQPNAGPGAARNTAIRATTADWILLLDADDVAYPERAAIQAEHLHQPNVAVICTHEVKASETSITFDVLWNNNRIPTSTVSLRRTAWESVGGFNESRALIGVEDYHLWLRLTHAGWSIVGLHEWLSRCTIYPTSLTAQTEAFVMAELANARALGEEFQLTPEAVRAKEFAILLEYGLEMFHDRRFALSQRFLREASTYGPLSLSSTFRLWLSRYPGVARMLP